ncbi:uncharacterized protein LOC143353098 isoform X2 [Halictus rubicundus]
MEQNTSTASAVATTAVTPNTPATAEMAVVKKISYDLQKRLGEKVENSARQAAQYRRPVSLSEEIDKIIREVDKLRSRRGRGRNGRRGRRNGWRGGQNGEHGGERGGQGGQGGHEYSEDRRFHNIATNHYFHGRRNYNSVVSISKYSNSRGNRYSRKEIRIFNCGNCVINFY